MVARCLWIGVVLIACGTSQGTRPVEPSPAAATPPAPASPPRPGSNAPADRPVDLSSQADMDALDRAIAPYLEQARRSYPDAKQRFLAGLPAGHKFAVVTELHSAGKSETVFIAVQRIDGDRITGWINNDIRLVTGYKAGDSYTLAETDLIDWVVVRPDGSEEGNIVGKFLDTWQPPPHP
jgi:uncharacterized protein YegJ (DUF2314 family)